MEIILIAAVDKNLAIGKDGKIPWEIKEDLKLYLASKLASDSNAIRSSSVIL